MPDVRLKSSEKRTLEVALETVQETNVECVSEPLVPVTVTEYVPAAAEPGLNVSVEPPLPETLVGLNVALAPEGVPPAARLTVPENPFCAVTVIAVVAEPLTLEGEEEMVKSADAADAETVQEIDVECVSEPLVPVTVTVYVPAAAVPGLNVSVEPPLPETLVGLSVALEPEGIPETARLTVPANPLTGLTVIVLLPAPVRLDGEAETVKSGLAVVPAALTTKESYFTLAS
jgi:hypothetical protein